jgi:arylsulfatase A-like enzyme
MAAQSGKIKKALCIYGVALVCAASSLALYQWWTWRPNIVLITFDALRPDHLGCYGYPRSTSPDIDRLAASSAVFTGAITAAPWTSASLASIMGSNYPTVHGLTDGEAIIDTRLPMLPEVLRRNGIKTGAFVNNPYLSGYSGHGFERGYDVYRCDYSARHGIEEKYKGDRELTSDALGWMSKNRKRPFFLWIHYLDPHAPYLPPQPYAGMFTGDDLYAKGAQAPISKDQFKFGYISEFHAKHMGFTRNVAAYVARYDGQIRFINDQFARLLRGMKELGVLHDSVLILSADHGESMGENDWYFEHGMANETIVRVPLIINRPGEEKGLKIGALVSLNDIAPTVLDMEGIPPIPAWEGRSLLPLIAGRGDKGREYVYGEGGSMNQKFIRSSRYKLIVKQANTTWPRVGFYKDIFGGKEELVELYDVAADPYETKNLVNEQPELASALRARLEEWKKDQQRKRDLFSGSGPTRATFDAQTREQLKALGYIQ